MLDTTAGLRIDPALGSIMSTSVESSVAEQSRVDLFAICSLAVGLLAFASMIGLGSGVPAAFAVGAGHVALSRDQGRPRRGRRLAVAGLILGYGVSIWALALIVGDLFTLAYPV